MAMANLVIVLTVCIVGFVAASHRLPSTFPRCHKNDPKLDSCLKNAVTVALNHSFKGVPSLGIFPLDPLMVTSLDIGNSQGGSVSISLKFQDLLIKGLSTIKLKSVKSDLKNYKLFFTGELSGPLILEGKYEADGKVIILPVRGKGNCKLKLDDVKATLAVNGREKKVNGVKYMEVVEVKLDFNTSRLHLHFDNLLAGASGAVGDGINTFLNENWKELLEDLKPGIEDGLGATFQQIANRVFSRVPYDQIFL